MVIFISSFSERLGQMSIFFYCDLWNIIPPSPIQAEIIFLWGPKRLL
jgi:hypothetical protein